MIVISGVLRVIVISGDLRDSTPRLDKRGGRLAVSAYEALYAAAAPVLPARRVVVAPPSSTDASSLVKSQGEAGGGR